jgi:hypothetical protein
LHRAARPYWSEGRRGTEAAPVHASRAQITANNPRLHSPRYKRRGRGNEPTHTE